MTEPLGRDETEYEGEGEDFSALIAELRSDLPQLLKTADAADFDAALSKAKLIAFSRNPQPVEDCIHILVEVAGAHMPMGHSHRAILLIERALQLAERSGLPTATRRVCNHYSLLSTDVGVPARGVEFALRAAALAHRLGDSRSVIAAFLNLTAALGVMGMYREAMSVAIRVVHRWSTAPDVGVAYANVAAAALALHDFKSCVDAARNACEHMGSLSDSHVVLNRMKAEINWLRGAIGLRQDAVVAQRLQTIRRLSVLYESPRLTASVRLAEAAVEVYSGNETCGIATLVDLLEYSKTLPSLHRDNLYLLIQACEARNDQAGALVYLGELVECLASTQVSAVRNALEAIRERVQTPMPGKDDALALITSIQAAPSLHRAGAAEQGPEKLYREALERLAVSAELREDAEGRCAYRVGRLAGLFASTLGSAAAECEQIELAGRLSDIGKLGIPDGLLMKPGKLTPAEFTVMQRHTTIGAQLLAQCTHPAFRLAEQIALCHHEKWDGTGYPSGLKGEEIPEAARIGTLADVYDALTHARAYRQAWTHDEAVKEIERMSGTHFEPRLVEAFVKLITRLRLEHGDALDDFLAKAGEDSTFIQARDKMQSVIDLIPE